MPCTQPSSLLLAPRNYVIYSFWFMCSCCVCEEAEMRVGVTHVGTLSVWLAWPWDAVVDISSELSTQTSSAHTKSLDGCLCDWSAKSKEKYFHLPAKGTPVCGGDINLSTHSWLYVVPQHNNIQEVGNMKLFHPSNSVRNAASSLLVTLRLHKSMKQLLDILLVDEPWTQLV